MNATLVVTMTLDTLRHDQPATLETGQLITAAYARKLACEAGLVPMVLGGKSVILDLGYRSRLFTEPQHLALNVRDKTCTALGCDWPPWLCHAHHDLPWSKAGKTDLNNARLLVPATPLLRPRPQVPDDQDQTRTRDLHPPIGHTRTSWTRRARCSTTGAEPAPGVVEQARDV